MVAWDYRAELRRAGRVALWMALAALWLLAAFYAGDATLRAPASLTRP